MILLAAVCGACCATLYLNDLTFAQVSAWDGSELADRRRVDSDDAPLDPNDPLILVPGQTLSLMGVSHAYDDYAWFTLAEIYDRATGDVLLSRHRSGEESPPSSRRCTGCCSFASMLLVTGYDQSAGNYEWRLRVWECESDVEPAVDLIVYYTVPRSLKRTVME